MKARSILQAGQKPLGGGGGDTDAALKDYWLERFRTAIRRHDHLVAEILGLKQGAAAGAKKAQEKITPSTLKRWIEGGSIHEQNARLILLLLLLCGDPQKQTEIFRLIIDSLAVFKVSNEQAHELLLVAKKAHSDAGIARQGSAAGHTLPEAKLVIPSTFNLQQYKAFIGRDRGTYRVYRCHSDQSKLVILQETLLIDRVKDIDEDQGDLSVKGDYVSAVWEGDVFVPKTWNLVGMATHRALIFHMWRHIVFTVEHEYMVILHSEKPMNISSGLRVGTTDIGGRIGAVPFVLQRLPEAQWVNKDEVEARKGECAGVIPEGDPRYKSLARVLSNDPALRRDRTDFLIIDGHAMITKYTDVFRLAT